MKKFLEIDTVIFDMRFLELHTLILYRKLSFRWGGV